MIFIDNKYTTTYYNIINNAKQQNRVKSKEQYFENHHILPKSLGGTNGIDNMVLLIPREHFVVHLLLTKMLVGDNKHKMSFALMMLTNVKNIGAGRYTPTSRLYEYARNESLKAIDNYWTPERRAKQAKVVSENNKNRKPVSEKTREKHRNKVWTEKAIASRLANCLKNAEFRKGKQWSKNKRDSNRLNYMKTNWQLALQVGYLKDNGFNNSKISRKLNVSWDKVKYMILYRNEFEHFAQSTLNG